MVRRFPIPLQNNQQIIQKAEPSEAPSQDFLAKEAVWLFVRDEGDLTKEERNTLTAIGQAGQTTSKIYELVQEFDISFITSKGTKSMIGLAKSKTARSANCRALSWALSGIRLLLCLDSLCPTTTGWSKEW